MDTNDIRRATYYRKKYGKAAEARVKLLLEYNYTRRGIPGKHLERILQALKTVNH